MSDLWRQLAETAGVPLSEAQIAQFHRYLDLLIEANERMNLTRIVDRAQAEVHHIADALTLLPFLPAEAHALVDIGSGGGVPGIPLAIARPDVSILLVESTRKKSAFLNSAIASLELKNISITDQRAEDVGQSGWRGTFDVATARAVAALPWLIEWTIPLLKKGGKLLAMKGPKVHEEIPQSARAIRLLHTSEPVLYPANLPDTENHLIVELIKQGATDKRYPRSATIAKGKPL